MKNTLLALVAVITTTSISQAWWGTSPEEKMRASLQATFDRGDGGQRAFMANMPHNGAGYTLRSTKVSRASFWRLADTGLWVLTKEALMQALLVEITFDWSSAMEGNGQTLIAMVMHDKPPNGLELTGVQVIKTDALSEQDQSEQAVTGMIMLMDALRKQQ